VSIRSDDRVALIGRLAFVALALSFCLIGLGATVRVMGAGLGCPDWPKCFGRLVPPTSRSEVGLGFDPAAFERAHAWLEYGNRLVGVVVGIVVLSLGIAALTARRQRPELARGALISVFLVVVAGALGGVVVAKDLAAALVTAHLVVALLLVSALAVVVLETGRTRWRPTATPGPVRRALLVLVILVAFQIALGSTVRGVVEEMSRRAPDLARAEWLVAAGGLDLGHRQVAVLVWIVSLFLALRCRRAPGLEPLLRPLSSGAFVVVSVQIGTGVALAYAGLPAVLEVVHLLLASLLVASLVGMVWWTWRMRPPEDARVAR
jgi:cytochrome c oxidase assembly protein subunit 15